MKGLLSFGFSMWVRVAFASESPFVLEHYSIDPNTISLGNGE